MEKGLNLYIDLDGTILDVSQRLYFLYADIANSLGGKVLPSKIYWQMKREQTPEEFIAKRSNIQDIRQYIHLRRERIELPRYLKHDKLIHCVIENLLELRESNRVILVTLRKSKPNMYKQLQNLRIDSVFDKILVANEEDEELWKAKAEVIDSDAHFKASNSVIVGDTETDILAGKFLNIGTIAVLSGMRNRTKLALVKPDFIIDGVNQLKSVLDNLPEQPKIWSQSKD